MDNKQFPERDEEEIIPEELTFFPADEESEETGDTPVSEEVTAEEPASQPEEIPVEAEEPVAEETPVAEDVPAFEDDSAQDDIPIFEDVPPIADAPAPEEIPAPDDTSEKGRSFMDRIPDVDDGMEESYDSRLTEPEIGSEIIPDESAMDSHGMLEHGEEEPPFDPAFWTTRICRSCRRNRRNRSRQRTRLRNRNTGTATAILTPQRMPPPRKGKRPVVSAPSKRDVLRKPVERVCWASPTFWSPSCGWH